MRATVQDVHDLAGALPGVTVIVFWVESLQEKDAMVLDESTPYFTTDHFDGHPSVLLRASRIGEIERDELEEVITSAWLSQAPKRMAKAFLER